MKRALTFADSHVKSRAHDVEVGIIWELEIVDTGHDTWKVVVGGVRGLAWFAYHSEHRSQAFEAYSND